MSRNTCHQNRRRKLNKVLAALVLATLFSPLSLAPAASLVSRADAASPSPVITITAPVSGASIVGVTTFQASADDPSVVSNIQFKLDDNTIGGQLTTSPYTLSWDSTTIRNGSHSLVAEATDTSNNVIDSAAVTFTVLNQVPPDTIKPSITIDAPINTVSVYGSILLKATASDNVGVTNVQFQVDGTNVGPAMTADPFQTIWDTTNVSDGQHTVTAIASDGAGNSATSSPVSVTVDNNASSTDTVSPTIALTVPQANTFVSGVVSVSANATDNVGVAGVQFKLDGNDVGAEVTTPPYTTDWDTSITAEGQHTLTAVARDAAGNFTTSVGRIVIIDRTPPTVAITKPATNNIVSGVIPLTVSHADNTGVVGVQYKLDGVNLGSEVTTPPFSMAWTTTAVPDGAHIVTAVARDGAGLTTESAACTVTINNTGVINTNNGDVSNGGTATATTGNNTTNGHDTPTPTAISTGDANAGVLIPNQVNKNVTNIAGVPQTSGGVDVTNFNQGFVQNSTSATGSTGNNTANNNRFSEIATGAAHIFTTIVNAVNTTLVGTNFNALVNNVWQDFTGNIDFLDMFLNFLINNTALPNTLSVNNVSSGTVTNNVNISASTGGNVADNNRLAQINTGNIDIGTSILNLLNTNIVGSNWLFSTTNMFANFTGNIILPGEGVIPGLYGDQAVTTNINNQNTADISNTLNVNADTGSNTATNNRDDAQISTGSVTSQTAVYNQVNTNTVGVDFFTFLPHLFGNWTGQVIDAANPGGGGYINTGLADNSKTLNVNNTNNATINNTVNIDAVTGQNDASSNRSSAISTGDINIGTNLLNIANTNLVGSNWFIGGFNLFGDWKGNIVYAYPDLTVTSSYPQLSQAGQQYTYSFDVANIGLAPARTVTLTDIIPDHTMFVAASDGGQNANGQVTWVLGGIAKNADHIVTMTVQVDPSLPAGLYSLLNHNTVTTVTPEPNTTNNSTVVQTNVAVQPGLMITTSNDAPAAVAAGDKVTYTLNVTNTGNVVLGNVVVHDSLPDHHGGYLFQKDFSTPSLAVGSTYTITYSVIVGNATNPGVYTNTAVASGSCLGAAITSAPASSSVIVYLRSQVVPASPVRPIQPAQTTIVSVPTTLRTGLVVKHLTKITSVVRQGDRLTFKISAMNVGQQPLNNVVLTSTLFNGKKSGLQWKLGKVASGEEVDVSYTLVLNTTAKTGKYLNTAIASGQATNKATVHSNSATISFTVKAVKKPHTITRTVATIASRITKGFGSVTVNTHGGLSFKDNLGHSISAWQYATLAGQSLLTVLAPSRDPVDQTFEALYRSGLSFVGQRGKNGVMITAADVLQNLAQQPAFANIFGRVTLALLPKS